MNTALDPATASPAEEAIYLFCLARSGALTAIDGAGVDDARALELISFRDIVAVMSAVKRDDFCGPEAEARMKDLAWLGPRACRHEAVTESVMRTSPVVPVRFATLFSSRERLAAWLASHYAAVAGTLEQFTAHQEWSVRGTLAARKAQAPLVAAALARGARSASPGVRYLEERRIRTNIGQELNTWLEGVCERIAQLLLQRAAEFRERPVGPKVSDDEGSPVLNWAFLVASERVGEFHACIDEINAAHAEQGLVLACSGPWPPYSFCPALDADRDS